MIKKPIYCKDENVDKPWVVYGIGHFGVAKVIRESGHCLDLLYANFQRNVAGWDSQFTHGRFSTPQEAINCAYNLGNSVEAKNRGIEGDSIEKLEELFKESWETFGE